MLNISAMKEKSFMLDKEHGRTFLSAIGIVRPMALRY